MKLKLIIIMVLFSTLSFAMENVNNKSSSSKSSIANITPLIFTLGYKIGSTIINHNETSEASNFIPLNNSSSIINNSIELGLIKEISIGPKISFSFLTNTGLVRGQDKDKDKDKLQKSDLSFTDKLTGYHYSIGGSLNLNLEAYNLKIQPFIFSSITNSNTTYLLNYSKVSTNSNSTTIQYKNNFHQTDFGTGIRFIDPKFQLMSFMSVNYAVSIKKKTDISSKNSNGKIDLTSNSNIKLRPLTFTIGFGFLF